PASLSWKFTICSRWAAVQGNFLVAKRENDLLSSQTSDFSPMASSDSDRLGKESEWRFRRFHRRASSAPGAAAQHLDEDARPYLSYATVRLLDFLNSSNNTRAV